MYVDPNDALRAAQAADRMRRAEAKRNSRDLAMRLERQRRALWDEWEAASSAFLDARAREQYAGAEVMRLCRRGPRAFWPKVAAWLLWSRTYGGFDSKEPWSGYYVIGDGKLALGSEGVLEVVQPGRFDINLEIEVLEGSLSAIRKPRE